MATNFYQSDADGVFAFGPIYDGSEPSGDEPSGDEDDSEFEYWS
jgi:hypothetical protein